jgi:spore coat protein U-like protein
MYIARLLLGFVVSTGFAVPAAIACDGQLEFGPRVVANGYSPFEPVDKQDQVRLSLENSSEQSCRFGLGFDYLPTGGKLGGELSYELTYDGRPLLGSSSAAAQPDLMLDIEGGQRKSLDLKFAIPRGQFVAPGEYADNIKVTLFYINDADVIELTSREITLVQNVYSDFSISVAGAGQQTTVDFGNLTQGASRNVKLAARSNTDYKLVLSSDNKGQLRLTPPVEGKDWTVDYDAVLDSRTLDLGKGEWSTSALAVTSSGLVEHHLEVTIGSTEAKRAGTYKDVLTIVIEAATP